jgi:hypothetical protein
LCIERMALPSFPPSPPPALANRLTHWRPALSISPAATTVPSTLVAPTAALARAPDWMPALAKTAAGRGAEGAERRVGGYSCM